MVRTCPHCGAVTAQEVRFCRHCGTPLKVTSTFSESEPVSPLAQTVPLSSEGHTTSGLGADEAGGSAPETHRVGRAEMDHLLSRSQSLPASGSGNIQQSAGLDQDYAAPTTSTLTLPAAVVAAAAPTAPPSATAGRRRRAWMWVTGLLLVLAPPSAAFIYYFLHRPVPESVNNTTTTAINSNQTTVPVNANAAAQETEVAAAEPQPEETPQPSPKPSPSIEPSREARARQERERETEAPVLTSTPTPVPAATPVTQATPTTPPAPSTAAGSNNDATTTQANADAFFFQAVNIVNGRDPRALQRAELVRALQLFLNVKSGPHHAEASQQAERLGRELDRRRKQSQP